MSKLQRRRFSRHFTLILLMYIKISISEVTLKHLRAIAVVCWTHADVSIGRIGSPRPENRKVTQMLCTSHLFPPPPPPPRHSGTLSGNSGGITAALRWFYAQTPRDFTSNLPDLKYPRETPGEFLKTKRSRGDCVQRILGAFLTSSDPTWLPERIAWRSKCQQSFYILM